MTMLSYSSVTDFLTEHAGTPSAVVVPLDVDMEQFTAKLLPTELREHVLMLAEVGAIEAEKVTTSFVGIGADTVRLVCTGIGASQAATENTGMVLAKLAGTSRPPKELPSSPPLPRRCGPVREGRRSAA